MRLTWLGHACFLLEENGYRVVIDPYDGVKGYPPLQSEAHAVYCSHDHFDHNAVELVTLLPEKASPFTIREIQTCHDDQGGVLRGPNTVRVFTAGGISVAHLGDLGHQLTAAQITDIGSVDLALVPVGGVYTVDAAGAKAVCEDLKPKCVVPMHYRCGSYGFDELTEVNDFLKLHPAEMVSCLNGPSFEVTGRETGILVPAIQESAFN